MQAEIDNAAGAIWRYLNEHGELTLSKLKQGTKLSDQLLFSGIGWLAREEKLNFTTEGRSVRVSLREHDGHQHVLLASGVISSWTRVREPLTSPRWRTARPGFCQSARPVRSPESEHQLLQRIRGSMGATEPVKGEADFRPGQVLLMGSVTTVPSPDVVDRRGPGYPPRRPPQPSSGSHSIPGRRRRQDRRMTGQGAGRSAGVPRCRGLGPRLARIQGTSHG